MFLYRKALTDSIFLKSLLMAFLLLFNSETGYTATYYFNKLFLASGNSYNVNTQAYTGVSSISGTDFRFFQEGAQFSGNNVNGVLTYINSSNVLVTVYGTISRQAKNGNTTQGFNFIVASSASFTSYTGEAFVIIVPGFETYFLKIQLLQHLQTLFWLH